MKKLNLKKKLMLSTLGAALFGIDAKASDVEFQIPNLDALTPDKQDYKVGTSCRNLIVLEDKGELTLNEQRVGETAFKILSQITDHPLGYCNTLSGAIIEKDPEEKLR
ncbi:MAG: hypothetical protein AAF203_04515 [Pseudomonadota bacterium]